MKNKELKRKADAGNVAAMRELAKAYLDEKKTDEAFPWMEKAANAGDAEAQYEMAELCRNKNDFNGSFQWEQKSAKQGFPKAQYNLAIHYQDGIGTTVNPKQQFYWHQKAAENGVTESKYLLAVCYLSKTGTPQDNKKAVYWLQQASNEGHVGAKTRLGAAYIEGIGISLDKEKGLSLLREAASLGDEKARTILREAGEEISGIESSTDISKVRTAKKEIKILLICSGIGLIIGTMYGIAGKNVLLGIWFGIGAGAILSFIPLIPGIIKTMYREKGSDGIGDLFLWEIVWFFIFGFAGPIGLVVQILRKNKQIKKFQKSGWK